MSWTAHKREWIILSLLAVSVLVFATVLITSRQRALDPGAQQGIASDPSPTNTPEKTEFGSVVAPDFPTDIPLEAGAQISQSYSLDYTGQRQLTIVFTSTQTVQENYALYADFLKQHDWTLVNQHESETLSFLYATKEQNAINVTLSADVSASPDQSQVSISVLKQ